MSTNYLEHLNDAQRAAVTHPQGSLLVLAGAGSGKTRVLTTRVTWLINQLKVDPSAILAVTFTNKAANEMLERINAKIELSSQLMWVGTFHSIALKILSRDYEKAGLSSTFQIIDSRDQLSLIKKIVNNLELDETRYSPREIQKYISTNKEQGIRFANLEREDNRLSVWDRVYEQYELWCNKESWLDFAELLLRCYELLKNNPDVLSAYQNRFLHILVDEFQDTNQLQYKLVKLLCGETACVFAVGDDDQSIYSFRGAKASNMQLFLKEFRVKEPVRLQQNYRSTTNILEVANAIISNNNNRIGKQLWTSNQDGAKVTFFQGQSEEEEADFIVREIRKLVNNQIMLNDIAILYRSNAQSRVLEQVLYNCGVAYKVYGGLRFFDRQEIKMVFAYLRLIVNRNDNEAFLRAVNFPPRGIGAKTIVKLEEISSTYQISLFESCTYLEGKTRLLVEQFNNLILSIADKKSLGVANIIDNIIKVTGMIDYYIQSNEINGKDKVENLNELVNATLSLNDNHQLSIEEFMLQTAIESPERGNSGESGAVKLMTAHASKGLEFKVVFIVGLEEGLFPHENSLNTKDGLEEERRLMYVAITRAREQLYLLRACNRLLWGRRQFTLISRFISEIPKSFLIVADNNDTPARSENILADAIDSRAQATSIVTPFKSGDIVCHDKFGKGKVLEIITDKNRVKAEIFFIGFGRKILDLSIAKIEKF
jgi:DNA helicase-2/ATP-dependent DNA helicase PcrA